jgi:hypothetical protein
MEWWNVLLVFIAMPAVCMWVGYKHGHEEGYDKGYQDALSDIKGNNEDFDHIVGGG